MPLYLNHLLTKYPFFKPSILSHGYLKLVSKADIMKKVFSILVLAIATIQLSNAQCRSSRTIFAIGLPGNQTFSIDETNGLSGVSGVTLQVKKQSYNGFSYGAMFNSRRMSYATTDYVISTSAQVVGLTLSQEIAYMGGFSVAPFANAYGGQHYGQWFYKTAQGSYSHRDALVGADVGLELDYAVSCQFGVYVRSSATFNKVFTGAESLPVADPISFRPFTELGLRVGI